MSEWRNWSGSVIATPAERANPRILEELCALVARAERVRVTGAGHSFMPLCETDGALISLADMEGELEVAPDRRSVWTPAGWSIARLTAALWDLGLSLANQGDIDKQAIAGALATGTHGTGCALGSLSTLAGAFRLVLADGSVVECDAERERDLFEAQRVSLGMLGVMAAVRLAVLPAYRLRETIRRVPLEEALAEWDQLAARHRHVEFFVFPYADEAMLKILEPVEAGDEAVAKTPADGAFQFACDFAAAAPFLAPTLQRLMSRAIGASSRAGPAFRIFPSERAVRFEEMEYEIPAAAGAETLRRAMAEVRRRRFPIIFPFEFRAVAGDDILLSPMNAGPCVSISFHQYVRMPWREAFATVEAVFAEGGGRPHWAKRHTLTSEDVVRLYPAAERWGATRKRVDPAGKFLNAHLRDLFAFSL
ncbi:MAG: D-arabinono-1,4-lactone oxidase [Caulobacteraceae bacterium]